MTAESRRSSKAGVIAVAVVALAAVYSVSFVPVFGWLSKGDPFASPSIWRTYNSRYEDLPDRWLVKIYRPMFDLCELHPELNDFVARHGNRFYFDWFLTKS